MGGGHRLGAASGASVLALEKDRGVGSVVDANAVLQIAHDYVGALGVAEIVFGEREEGACIGGEFFAMLPDVVESCVFEFVGCGSF